ncbi:hypothetical protein A6R68_16379 [Neotoma lepida]|uniref:RanBP2-type domain-containing protein n=1 Tax=Neotoma lepida TaxID=56216 RepID=A0A1A6HHQ1_NEOLE|nr:hypothetical protein A6R68_16379 [Neotoma lepida]
MALNPEDLGSGFRHTKVSTFINEQMAKHDKGPDFYLENLSLSWEEVEDKLKVILEDSKVSMEAREACAWGTLALAVRFAHRQGCLHGQGVQWLQDLSGMHKVSTFSLSSDLKQLTHPQQTEPKEVATQLQLAQAKLAEVQRERDLLRLKIIQTELRALPTAVKPAVPIPSAVVRRAGTGTQWSAAKEDLVELMAAATGRRENGAEMTAAAPEGTISAPKEASEEPNRSFLQLFEVMKRKNYPSKKQRVGDLKTKETSTSLKSCPLSQSLNQKSTSSSEPITVQLPASFTYSYESPFPAIPTTSQLSSTDRHLQIHPFSVASETSQLSDMGIHRGDHQELQKEKRSLAFRRPGDWDCPWCKAVNFSRRENCFHCGKGIWLQNPYIPLHMCTKARQSLELQGKSGATRTRNTRFIFQLTLTMTLSFQSNIKEEMKMPESAFPQEPNLSQESSLPYLTCKTTSKVQQVSGV